MLDILYFTILNWANWHWNIIFNICKIIYLHINLYLFIYYIYNKLQQLFDRDKALKIKLVGQNIYCFL